MPRIIIIDRAGTGKAVDGQAGASVMEIIRGAGFDELVALCGGCCSCATCHVYVDPAFLGLLSPPSEDEADLLEGSAHRRPNSRLSCQIPFGETLEGLIVHIAPEE